jgi:hypothetical protein
MATNTPGSAQSAITARTRALALAVAGALLSVTACANGVAVATDGATSLTTIGSPTLTTSAVTCSITVRPGDSYQKLEAAAPGQTVCISPGVYSFRVTLSKKATASKPIVIKALDPRQRPVFDYSGWGNYTDDLPPFPGSYSAGDAARSAWRVTGSYYTIDGIIIRNANNQANGWDLVDNTAGIRYLHSSHLTVKNCLLANNDMGIQGGGKATVIQATEFAANGVPNSDQSHNLYVLGGDSFTLRSSYLHDAVGGQNFHVRARKATLSYNWFENAADYEGDMMTNQKSYDPGANGRQKLVFIGNVVVQNQHPDNQYKLITLYNDSGRPKPRMDVTALWNTFVFRDSGLGTASTSSAPIQFSKRTLAGGKIIFSNNVVAGVGARRAVTSDSGSASFSLSGRNNFFLSGSKVSTLTRTTFARDAGFVDPGAGDYRLRATSPAFKKAKKSLTPRPSRYFITPPFIAPASLSADVAKRTRFTNPGALQ